MVSDSYLSIHVSHNNDFLLTVFQKFFQHCSELLLILALSEFCSHTKTQLEAGNIDVMSFNSNKVHFLLNKFLWKVVELFKSIFEIISVQKRHKKSNMSEQEFPL